MYKVIRFFTDLKDDSRPYNVGDIFPRKGLDVTQKRLDELASSNNKQGRPLIEEIPDPIVSEPEVEPAEVDEVVEIKPKRNRKRK